MVRNGAFPADRLARWSLVGFWVCSAVHLVLVAVELEPYDSVTKALLMPLLAAWAASAGGPALLVAALLFSWGGDVLLSIDGWFVPGMILFGAAHVCYIWCFVRRGALRRLRRRPVVPLLYGLGWVAGIAVLWSGLGAMRLPVMAYSLLLFASATVASTRNRRTALGGLLFLLSDTLIGVRLGGLPLLPLHGVVIMGTYVTAQYLLASGLLRDTEHALVAAPR
ncbi:lysoplasmalogenase [Nonomuraea sp. WAC 01424]|nr:lysoplasmalogenase [Nonomuraea sp. WAC 01424]